jgi:hypothetical protein
MKGHLAQKRPKGNYYAVLSVRDPATGRRKVKWVALKTKLKREAEERLVGIVAKYNEMGATPKSNREQRDDTLGAFLRSWIDTHECEPRTRRDYNRYIADSLIPSLGHLPLSQLDPGVLEQHFLDKRDRDADGALLPATRALELEFAVLRAALNDAVGTRRIPWNPLDLHGHAGGKWAF